LILFLPQRNTKTTVIETHFHGNKAKEMVEKEEIRDQKIIYDSNTKKTIIIEQVNQVCNHDIPIKISYLSAFLCCVNFKLCLFALFEIKDNVTIFKR
jgi:hypothetical protein